ncbi:MAG TPA: protein kinase [Gemmatimonas sp.]|nr:protein kinase [Gemmatimonas sp.]
MKHPPDVLETALADRYTHLSPLGEGGMATVYRAHDVKHDRDVALKVLRPELGESLGRERFLREIRLAASLTHPHILPLHDSGETHGLLWFTMPLMGGETLRDRMAAGPMALDEAVRFAGEVADALDYAHRHDIVHRDIKPENILLHEGHAVVADFGIGKALVAASEHAMMHTQIGITVGTPAYMSPEQAAGDDVDGRSDLFALGCVLFEMLTGEVAFSGPTVQATIARRFVHTPPPAYTLRPEVPAALAQLIDRLLAKSVDERVSSGAQVAQTLRAPVLITTPTSAPATHTERSVVVLPFANVSPDADTEYFSDGLTDELITDLSRVKALRIISRTTAMQYKGSSQTLREIGAAVGVRWALTGSVRRAGSALRISAQLVDVQRDEPAWAEKYSGTLDDVFDVQERVSRAIVQALDVVLSPQENAQLAARPLQDVRAFELYLKAREALGGYDVARAAPLIARAVEIAGRVPVLRALEALSGIMQLRTGASRDPALIASIEREARALIAEAPDFAQGYALLGYLAYEIGDQVTAVQSLRRAFALDSADTDIRFFLGIAGQAGGHPDVRAGLAWHAIDPLSPLAHCLVAANTWWTGRFSDGTRYMEEAVRLAPAGPIFRWGLGNHYALLGRYDDAERQVAWLHDNAMHFPYTPTLQGLVLGALGRHEEALAVLDTIEMASLDHHHLFHLAESYAAAGADAKAVALTLRAVDMGFHGIADYCERYSPFYEPLRDRADFHEAMVRARALAARFRAAVAEATS